MSESDLSFKFNPKHNSALNHTINENSLFINNTCNDCNNHAMCESDSIDGKSNGMSDVCVQVNTSDDNTGAIFELKRSNANMKGKLEHLGSIVDHITKESSVLQLKINSLEKELKQNRENFDEMSSHRETLIAENEELRCDRNKWESIANEFQDVIQVKSLEIETNNEDIKRFSRQNEKLKIECKNLRIDFESKDNENKELSKKCAQTTIECDSLIQNKLNLMEEINRIKKECDAKTAEKESIECEFNKLQIELNETQQKLVLECEASVNIRNELYKSNALNSVLKQQITDIKRNSVKEKEILMRHLEGIGVDLVLKEAENQWISPKFDELNLNKEEFISSDLNEKLREKENESNDLKQQLKHTIDLNEKLIKEHENNLNDINAMKKNLNDANSELSLFKSANSELASNVETIKVELERLKQLNHTLRNDKTVSQQKLIDLSIDYKSVENNYNILKENGERSLTQLQTNIIEKDSKIESLEKEMLEFNDLMNIKELELSQIRQTIESKNIDVNGHTDVLELEFKQNELQTMVNRLSSEMRTNLAIYEQEKNILLANVSDLQNRVSDEKIQYNNLNEKLTKEIQINNGLNGELVSIKLEKNEMKTLLEAHKNSANREQKYSNNDILQEKDKKIRCLESNVNLLMKKYKEALKLKKKNEHKVESLPTIADRNFVSTQTDECNCAVEEINQLKESIKLKDVLLENNERTLLNLEYEKERLASVSNSYLQNIDELKLLVTSNSKQVSDLTQNLDDVQTKCGKQLTELENELKKERALVKDLRHTIFIEKRENSNHKKDVIDLKNALKTSNLVADNNKQHFVNMESEMEKQKDLEQSLCNEIKLLKSELTQLKEDNSNCNAKINELLEKTELIKSLKQNLLERDEEIMALKSENESIKNVFDVETMGLKHQILNYRNDIEQLSCDLNEARKQKLSVQTYLSELSIEVKNSHEEIKRLRDRLKCYELIIANETIFNEEMLNNTFMKLPNKISISK